MKLYSITMFEAFLKAIDKIENIQNIKFMSGFINDLTKDIKKGNVYFH